MTKSNLVKILIEDKANQLFVWSFFLIWLLVVSYLSWNHAVWRDEVRALSVALQGDDIFAMIKGLHGEGHPALWYFLLRSAHTLFPLPEVLQIVALIVAFISFLLLVRKSPFSLLFVVLILFSKFAVYEYSVMARNYGISMLLLFVIAACYERYHDRGVLLGVLLFLLANCNVHSALLVGSFLVFWLLDNIKNDNIDQTEFIKIFLVNAAIAVLGIVLCAITIYRPFNDAAVSESGVTIKLLTEALFLPATSFISLMPRGTNSSTLFLALGSLLMFGSTLGLIRRPAALFAACISLIGLSLFFNIIYEGYYRHNALWLVFLISLYWIVFQKNHINNLIPSQKTKAWIQHVSKLGYILTMLLLFIQVIKIIPIFFNQPESRSKEFGMLISKNPDLLDATIIADPDFLLEPLPYYIQNRTYLMTEQRLGNVVVFTKHAKLSLTLDDILREAHALRTKFGKPVVILLKHHLDLSETEQIIKEGYNWKLSTSPEQVRKFQASTRLIKRFDPVLTGTGENFDVYVLD